MSGTPKLKLSYFGTIGRGEPARLMLHYAGVQFEDERFPPDDMPIWKSKLKYGQCPQLLIDGVAVSESWAIYRYVARLTNLAGKTDLEVTQIDESAEFFRNWVDGFTPYIRTTYGFIPGNAEELFKSQYVPVAERYLPIIDAEIAKSENGFFAKSGISWVDFVVAIFFRMNMILHPELFEKYENLVAHSDRIHALPEIQEYLKDHMVYVRTKTS